MKIWQLIAIPVCIGVWLFIAAANLDAMSSLAGDGILFDQHGVTITARHAYAVVSLSADAILAITAVAVFWQAERRHRMRAALAVVAWAICAAVSWHSMWIWLGKNQHGNIVESTQSMDVYEATKVQFDDAQKHYSWLTQTKTSKMGPKTLAAHTAAVKAAEDRLDELRRQLAATDIKVAAKPIPYFDVLGATLLLILNTICWPAIFGPKHRKVAAPQTAATSQQVAALNSPPPAHKVAQVEAPDEPATGSCGGGKKANEIIAATPVPPAATSAATLPEQEPATAPPPSPPPQREMAPPPPHDDPPPPAATNPPPPPANDTVVVLGESHAVAVKRWRRQRTDDDPDAFTKSSELWSDYQRTGSMKMRRDEFFKAIAAEMGGPVKKKAGRGYVGIKLLAITKKKTAT